MLPKVKLGRDIHNWLSPARLAHHCENISLKIYFFSFFSYHSLHVNLQSNMPDLYQIYVFGNMEVLCLEPLPGRTCCPAASSFQPLLCLPQFQSAALPKVTPFGHPASGDRARQGYKCLAPGIPMLLAEAWAWTSCVTVHFPPLSSPASFCSFPQILILIISYTQCSLQRNKILTTLLHFTLFCSIAWENLPTFPADQFLIHLA